MTAIGAAQTVIRFGALNGSNELNLSRARGSLDQALAAKGLSAEWRGPFAASSPAVEALTAGAIDVTVGSSTSSIAAIAAGKPITLFGYRAMSPLAEAIIVPAGSTARSLADLVGQSVAVNRGGTGEYLLVRGLETQGIDAGAVRRVYLSPADTALAFAAGQVAAWAIWDPYLSIALTRNGGRILAAGSAIGDENATVMIASQDFAKRRPDVTRLIFDTLKADVAWAREHPREAGLLWTKADHLPDALADRLAAANIGDFRAVGAAEVSKIQSIADWYVGQKIVPPFGGLADHVMDLGE